MVADNEGGLSNGWFKQSQWADAAIDFLTPRLYNRSGSCGFKFAKGRYVTIMRLSGLAVGIVAIVVGILVLAVPHLLQWILGIGLIVVGVLAIARK